MLLIEEMRAGVSAKEICAITADDQVIMQESALMLLSVTIVAFLGKLIISSTISAIQSQNMLIP